MRIDPPAEDVEHARRYPRSRTLSTVRPPTRVHDMEYRERPAESGQSVLDC